MEQERKDDVSSLEALAMAYYEAGITIQRLEEEREKCKIRAEQILNVTKQSEHRFRLNELYDLKIKLGSRNSKIIDKIELANDLGVSESSINLEFLLKAVEDRKLSFAKFKQYCHQEVVDQISIRRVNAN